MRRTPRPVLSDTLTFEGVRAVEEAWRAFDSNSNDWIRQQTNIGSAVITQVNVEFEERSVPKVEVDYAYIQ